MLALPLAWAALLPGRLGADTPPDTVMAGHYRVYTSAGDPATLDDVAAAMDSVAVVFVGETHDDPVAHVLEARLLQAAHERYGLRGDATADRPVALSLEMFDRDVQLVVDEYLDSLITERHFREAGRAWQNYEGDYHPLVAFARAQGLAVIAANAPRRYVNRVSRRGPGSLAALPPAAKAWLPPLPYAPASPAYKAKWDRLMQESMAAMPHPASRDSSAGAQGDTTHVPHAARPAAPSYALDAQALWDAAMAYSIAEHLMRVPAALVVHVTGGFHVEGGTGTPEQLERYRPGTPRLVVAIRPADTFTSFDPERFEGLGDFVILTDARLPRSYASAP
jgi:uncharacterized iron-regulated protein